MCGLRCLATCTHESRSNRAISRLPGVRYLRPTTPRLRKRKRRLRSSVPSVSAWLSADTESGEESSPGSGVVGSLGWNQSGSGANKTSTIFATTGATAAANFRRPPSTGKCGFTTLCRQARSTASARTILILEVSIARMWPFASLVSLPWSQVPSFNKIMSWSQKPPFILSMTRLQVPPFCLSMPRSPVWHPRFRMSRSCLCAAPLIVRIGSHEELVVEWPCKPTCVDETQKRDSLRQQNIFTKKRRCPRHIDQHYRGHDTRESISRCRIKEIEPRRSTNHLEDPSASTERTRAWQPLAVRAVAGHSSIPAHKSREFDEDDDDKSLVRPDRSIDSEDEDDEPLVQLSSRTELIKKAWICCRTRYSYTVAKKKRTSSLARPTCPTGTRCVRKLA